MGNQEIRKTVSMILALVICYALDSLPFITDEKKLIGCVWMLVFLSLNEVLKNGN